MDYRFEVPSRRATRADYRKTGQNRKAIRIVMKAAGEPTDQRSPVETYSEKKPALLKLSQRAKKEKRGVFKKLPLASFSFERCAHGKKVRGNRKITAPGGSKAS
jgi:hypothetical protein